MLLLPVKGSAFVSNSQLNQDGSTIFIRKTKLATFNLINPSAVSVPITDIGFDATLKRIQRLRFHIDEVSAIDTLYEYLKKRKPDILIINPALLGYASLSMLREECACPKLKCVALLYAVAERSLLNQYDEFITIYDSAEEIKNKLEFFIVKMK